VLGKGEALGELGIINKKSRSLTAVSNNTKCIMIDDFTFRKTMKSVLKQQLNEKVNFITK
jgi:hypothetical protein